ncbi:hypothetical protein CLV58_105191 [Spirosoma oryzae]|uniref:TMF family protein n=1 Tax=Spirosoma oryzae TaxID=1469603 RepID=A0A2T0T8K3_9BACT|nr:hypothetical protein CLV58_105191 [Spirosoma oryzae]
MKFFYVAALILVTSLSLQAQTNYVANTANSQTPGTNNTLVGPQAGSVITSGNNNSFVGYNAGNQTTTGGANTFMGALAGQSNTEGSNNIFVGSQAGYYNRTGSQNVTVGNSSGGLLYTGSSNTYLGHAAGSRNPDGSFNTILGSEAGRFKSNGFSNVVIGVKAGAGQPNTLTVLGNNNVLIGDSTGLNNVASGNVFLGSKSGYTNQSGNQNTLLGYQAGYNLTSSSNTLVGYQAGRNITTGSNNIIVGPMSGTAITDGSDNVLMGYNSQAEDGLHNATAIGAGSRVAVSNALILGNGVNVGIGTSAPATRLEVVSPQADQSGLRLTSLTTNSPSALTTDQFLTVNAQGDVVKARYQLRISDVSQWSDKVFSPTYQLRPLSAVANYVREQGHLPGVPSAEQVKTEGVDLVKMNSLLLEKVEELTLYGIDQQKRLDKQQSEIDELKQLVKQLMKK